MLQDIRGHVQKLHPLISAIKYTIQRNICNAVNQAASLVMYPPDSLLHFLVPLSLLISTLPIKYVQRTSIDMECHHIFLSFVKLLHVSTLIFIINSACYWLSWPS